MVSCVPCDALLLCQDSYDTSCSLRSPDAPCASAANPHDTTFVSLCKAFVSHMVKYWLSLVISMGYMRFPLDDICDTRDFYGISGEILENTMVISGFHMLYCIVFRIECP